MISIDDNTLTQLGLDSLSDKEKQDAKAKIAGIFEDRLGNRLMDNLSDEQLKEFEDYVIGADPQGGLKWLEQNVPQYQDIVGLVFTQMMKEIKDGGLAVLDHQPAE